MIALYFSPGACSMASHITLEEIGEPYEERPTLIPKGEHRAETYLKTVNPRGKVPSLDADGKVLTENVAILTYLAKRFPAKKLLPADPFQEALCLSTMAYFSNTVHTAFAHFARPERYAANEASHADVKEMAKKNFFGLLGEIDGMLAGKDWIMGAQFTVADPYALVFYGWGLRAGLPMKELKNYTAFKDRMMARPAVRRVLEREDSPILKAA
jgi:glutathione S-transferase